MSSSPAITPAPTSSAGSGEQGSALWVNSTIAFVLAASVAVTLHETAHAVAGLAQGSPVVLGSFSADATRPLGATGAAVMTAAGPVFSLVFGLLIIALARQAGRGFGRLFWTWLGFISTQNFVGYLLITPFGAGDSGAFIDELDLGTGVAIVFCVVGVLGYLLLARGFVRRIVRYVDNAADLRRIGLFAWLAGTAVVVIRTAAEAGVSGAPANQIVVVMAGAASCGIFAPLFTGAWQRLGRGVTRERLPLGRPWPWLVLAVIIIVLQIAVLAPGVHLG